MKSNSKKVCKVVAIAVGVTAAVIGAVKFLQWIEPQSEEDFAEDDDDMFYFDDDEL